MGYPQEDYRKFKLKWKNKDGLECTTYMKDARLDYIDKSFVFIIPVFNEFSFLVLSIGKEDSILKKKKIGKQNGRKK